MLEEALAVGVPDPLDRLALAAGAGEPLGADCLRAWLAALPGLEPPDLGAELAELLGAGDARASTLVDARIRCEGRCRAGENRERGQGPNYGVRGAADAGPFLVYETGP
jgi:hypothetical protein